MKKIKALMLGIFISASMAFNSYAHVYSDIVANMTHDDYVLLEKIVAAESQTECFEGRVAVVETIFNRVLSEDPYYPNTVSGVLSQPGQFSSYPLRNDSWVEPEYATEAIAYVSANGLTVLPDTDYLFFSRGKSKYAKDFIKIEHHYFGRMK